MSQKQIKYKIGILILSTISLNVALAENIDPYEDGSQYAYGENIGWLDFEPNDGPGVTVSSTKLTGKVWGVNVGWIHLDPNDTDPNTGVRNDGTGRLSGLAWGENIGLINFNPKVPNDPNEYGVIIDENGKLSGWAWGENIGWIRFQSNGPIPFKVQACVVRLDDLANFADDWLKRGNGLEGDLNGNNEVNFSDYSMFSAYWSDYCPDNWLLK